MKSTPLSLLFLIFCLFSAWEAQASSLITSTVSGGVSGVKTLTIRPAKLNESLTNAYSIPWPVDQAGRPLSGTSVLLALVDQRGKVVNVQLTASSGYDALDAAASEGVRRWHFAPEERNGTATEGYILIPIIMEPDNISQSIDQMGAVSTQNPAYASHTNQSDQLNALSKLSSTYNGLIASQAEHLLASLKVPSGEQCDLTLVMLPGGLVFNVQPGTCSFSSKSVQAVRDALKMKKFPYKGFESVFLREAHIRVCSSKATCGVLVSGS